MASSSSVSSIVALQARLLVVRTTALLSCNHCHPSRLHTSRVVFTLRTRQRQRVLIWLSHIELDGWRHYDVLTSEQASVGHLVFASRRSSLFASLQLDAWHYDICHNYRTQQYIACKCSSSCCSSKIWDVSLSVMSSDTLGAYYLHPNLYLNTQGVHATSRMQHSATEFA